MIFRRLFLNRKYNIIFKIAFETNAQNLRQVAFSKLKKLNIRAKDAYASVDLKLAKKEFKLL
jgi:hypothetical protein